MSQLIPTKNESTNIQAVINQIISKQIPKYEKILYQLKVYRERGNYQSALKLYTSGCKLVRETEKNETKLKLFESKYMHEASAIYYCLKKPIKAISYSQQALSKAKGILDNSHSEILRYKEIIALSYEQLNELEEAIPIFLEILYGMNQYVDGEKGNQNGKSTVTEIEWNKWKGKILYKLGFNYNSNKQFKEASNYAKECLKIREIWEKDSENHLLSLMLVSVVVSAPVFSDYKTSLDALEKCKVMIKQDKKGELKKYSDQINKLSGRILVACIRYCKLNKFDLNEYVKTGKKNNQKTK